MIRFLKEEGRVFKTRYCAGNKEFHLIPEEVHHDVSALGLQQAIILGWNMRAFETVGDSSSSVAQKRLAKSSRT